MKSIKDILKLKIDKIKSNNFSKNYKQAVKNLGGIENSSKEYHKLIFSEVERIKMFRKEKYENMMLSFMISLITTLIGLIIQHYHIL